MGAAPGQGKGGYGMMCGVWQSLPPERITPGGRLGSNWDDDACDGADAEPNLSNSGLYVPPAGPYGRMVGRGGVRLGCPHRRLGRVRRPGS